MYEADSYEHAGISVQLYYDEDAENPYAAFCQLGELLIRSDDRNWSGLDGATKRDVCSRTNENWTAGMAARYLTLMEGYAAAVPFRLDDYGSRGARAYTVGADEELAYVTGFIVTTVERCEELGVTLRGAELASALASEFEGDFGAYVSGDVYGYVVAGGSVDEDSVWGFYGYDYAKQEAKEAAEHVAQERARRLARGVAAAATYCDVLRRGVLA